jgi:hypothetical protein
MKTSELPKSSLEKSEHADPISGEPGSHPVGTGVGAAAGGAALAAMGSVAGPVGIAVGAVVGAVVGGLTGKGFAEGLDPTAEEAHWRAKHPEQPYAAGSAYEVYAVAYRVGYQGYREGHPFTEREAELQREYESGQAPAAMEYNLSTKPLHEDRPSDAKAFAERTPGSMEDNLTTKPLAWSEARVAAQAAYERVEAARAAQKEVSRER